MRPGIRDLRSKTDFTEGDLQLVLGEVVSANAEDRAGDLADALLTLSFVVKWVRSDNDQDPFSRSRTLALEALAIYESMGNKNGIISALLDSLVWQPPEEVDKVLKRALSLAQEIGDELPIAQVYSRMAAHSGMRDRPQAIELSHKAKDIYEKLGQRRGIAFCLNQLVIFYESSDEKAKAGLRAAALFAEGEDFSSAAQSLSMVLGLASNGMTLPERKNLALRLLGYSQKLKGRSKEKLSYAFLKKICLEMGELEEAEKYHRWHEELEAADGLTPKERAKMNRAFEKQMAKMAEAMGQTELAEAFRKGKQSREKNRLKKEG